MSTDPMDLPDIDGMELVMPFVVCQSEGGPFDDEAFVAGFQAGQLDKALRAAAAVDAGQVRATVVTALVPQLELIAMHHGFTVEVTPASVLPEWCFVTFGAQR